MNSEIFAFRVRTSYVHARSALFWMLPFRAGVPLLVGCFRSFPVASGLAWLLLLLLMMLFLMSLCMILSLLLLLLLLLSSYSFNTFGVHWFDGYDFIFVFYHILNQHWWWSLCWSPVNMPKDLLLISSLQLPAEGETLPVLHPRGHTPSRQRHVPRGAGRKASSTCAHKVGWGIHLV